MSESFGCVGGNGPKGWIANLGSWNYAWHQPRGYVAIFRKCAQVLWEEYLRDWVSECEGGDTNGDVCKGAVVISTIALRFSPWLNSVSCDFIRLNK